MVGSDARIVSLANPSAPTLSFYHGSCESVSVTDTSSQLPFGSVIWYSSWRHPSSCRARHAVPSSSPSAPPAWRRQLRRGGCCSCSCWAFDVKLRSAEEECGQYQSLRELLNSGSKWAQRGFRKIVLLPAGDAPHTMIPPGTHGNNGAVCMDLT